MTYMLVGLACFLLGRFVERNRFLFHVKSYAWWEDVEAIKAAMGKPDATNREIVDWAHSNYKLMKFFEPHRLLKQK
jgi:hypothetical protein